MDISTHNQPTHLREKFLEKCEMGFRIEGLIERKERARTLQTISRHFQLCHGVDVLYLKWKLVINKNPNSLLTESI